VTYFPDASLAGLARTAAGARYFAPDLGEFVAHAAREGPLVVLT
jgi:hypothetical protein